MNIKLCKKKENLTRKGKYIDKKIAMELVEISRGVRAFREQKYGKALHYLEKKALNPKATERIKFIVGTSYTETKIHEKEAAELLKSIIQNHKDKPKENRPAIYSGAILEYAKIQLRNELTEFAIYLLEDIAMQDDKHNIYALIELSKAYDMQAQELRNKEKEEEALEIEKNAEKVCLKCKELAQENPKLSKDIISARNLLGILYIRQGKFEMVAQELIEVNKIYLDSKNKDNFNCLDLLKETYFKEESEEEVNKRIKRLEKKLEAIENGEEEEKKEYARELDLVSRSEFYEELSPDLKISRGIDIFTGYKMYEYPQKGVCVIDKIFDEIKEGKKVLGKTYVFPQDITFELENLSRIEVVKMLETNSSVQKETHKGDYYNYIQEKMKRAELEGLVEEEKRLKEKEKELEDIAKIEEIAPIEEPEEKKEEEGEQ